MNTGAAQGESSVPGGGLADLARETARRRTFAIISHPDAGKTTLTEKLLLYSGMIQTAGMVRGRKRSDKGATSDWMAMERERGISITTSAMQFEYKGVMLNVLDTPGHQDFSEDTYRTLTAADAAVMVIDATRGVEAQTRKLFEVCRIRRIPVLTFINKMDLHGREPLDLMAEVEQVLGIHASAMNWPVGKGREFAGVVDRNAGELILFTKTSVAGARKASVDRVSFAAVPPDAGVDGSLIAAARHELDLLDAAGNPFSLEAFLAGLVTPVFFGSALTNFGVEPFFDAFIGTAPPPGPRTALGPDGGEVVLDPVKSGFSAYVFKVQANMNRRHRDTLAFMRICSGRFERDMTVRHHRTGKEVRLSQSQTMFASDRNRLDVAWPGDVVGVVSGGQYMIGDTLSAKGGFDFKPLPAFPPEVFAEVRPSDPGRRKSYDKGMDQLTREGTIQILHRWNSTRSQPIIAAVGKLQFEVFSYRMKDEYGVECVIEPLPYTSSAWLGGDPATLKTFHSALLVRDRLDRPMILYADRYRQMIERENKDHTFSVLG
jgi:peptide chain release factor 3